MGVGENPYQKHVNSLPMSSPLTSLTSSQQAVSKAGNNNFVGSNFKLYSLVVIMAGHNMSLLTSTVSLRRRRRPLPPLPRRSTAVVAVAAAVAAVA